MAENPYSGHVYTFRRLHLPRFSDLLPRTMEWESSPFWETAKERLMVALGPSRMVGRDGYDSHLAIFESMEFEPRYTDTDRRSKKPLRIGLRCEPLSSFLFRNLRYAFDNQWRHEDELREVVNESIYDLVVAELGFEHLVFLKGKRVRNASKDYTDVPIMTKWDATDQAKKHLIALKSSLRDLRLPVDELEGLMESLDRISGRQAVNDALNFLYPGKKGGSK